MYRKTAIKKRYESAPNSNLALISSAKKVVVNMRLYVLKTFGSYGYGPLRKLYTHCLNARVARRANITRSSLYLTLLQITLNAIPNLPLKLYSTLLNWCKLLKRFPIDFYAFFKFGLNAYRTFPIIGAFNSCSDFWGFFLNLHWFGQIILVWCI